MEKNILNINRIIPLVTLFIVLAADLSLAQRSLYSDVKAHRVGDVITVIMTENIRGSSSIDTRTSSNTAGSASGGV